MHKIQRTNFFKEKYKFIHDSRCNTFDNFAKCVTLKTFVHKRRLNTAYPANQFCIYCIPHIGSSKLNYKIIAKAFSFHATKFL